MRQIHQIQPQLHALEVALPDFSVRGVVIIGERYAAIWDTLVSPADMAALQPLVGDKAFHVIYSHAHYDHIWGTQGLWATPLSICAHANCLEQFGGDAQRTLQQMREEAPGMWDDVILHPPDLTFDTRLDLDLGGITLELHHLPGHSEDCIVGWLPDWGVLLGGDAIETPLPVVNDARSIRPWLQALEGWAANPELRLTIPSHGVFNGRRCLESTIGYLRCLLDGDDFDLPAQLDPFYRDTHKQNLQLVKADLLSDD